MAQPEYPGNGYAPYQYQCGAAYPPAYPHPPAPAAYSPGAACYSMPPPQHLPPHDKQPKDPRFVPSLSNRPNNLNCLTLLLAPDLATLNAYPNSLPIACSTSDCTTPFIRPSILKCHLLLLELDLATTNTYPSVNHYLIASSTNVRTSPLN